MSLLVPVMIAGMLQAGLDAVANERVAAQAMEAHVVCIARATEQRSEDARAIEIVAAEAVAACVSEASQLRAAIEDVFRRHPDRMAAGSTPETAASAYVAAWNDRAAVVLREHRERRR